MTQTVAEQLTIQEPSLHTAEDRMLMYRNRGSSTTYQGWVLDAGSALLATHHYPRVAEKNTRHCCLRNNLSTPKMRGWDDWSRGSYWRLALDAQLGLLAIHPQQMSEKNARHYSLRREYQQAENEGVEWIVTGSYRR